MNEKSIALKQGISAVAASATHELGVKVQIGDAEYKYVYNDVTNSEIAVGVGLVPNTGAASPYSMIVSGGSAARYKGVNQNVTIPTGNYFWMLTKGPVVVQCPSAAKTIGDGIYPTSGATGSFQAASAPTGLATAAGSLSAAAVLAAIGEIKTAAGANDATVSIYFYGKYDA